MSSADRVAHIDGQLMQLIEQYTRAQRSITFQSNKNRAIHLRMFAGFCFNNIFCAAATRCIDSFLLPNSRNEEMMGDGFLWCYCRRFVLNSKRLLSTSCNKQGQRSSECRPSFMVLFLMLFEVRRICMCRKLNKP